MNGGCPITRSIGSCCCSCPPRRGSSRPSRLPADYFSALAALAPGKPFAIAETAWPAEDVTVPYPVTIRSNADYQKRYVEIRDYDALWSKVLLADPNAALIRLWRDTGLYDGDGAPRPSLSSWRSVLSRPLR